jgi:hypothetical protein
MRVLALVAAWCVLLAMSSAMVSMPSSAAVVGLGLVARDGSLRPLARLEGDAWTPLAGEAAAGAWQVWLFDDPIVKASPFSPRTARAVTASVAVGAGAGACLATRGLDAAALASNGGAPWIGIALAGSDARPDVSVEVAPESDLGRQLAARAAPSFHRADDETLTLEAEELPAGFPRFAARRERPVTWTRIVRQGVAQGSAKAYYLEGRKDYEGFTGRTDIGRIRTTGHVFVRLSGGRETMDAEVDLSDVEGRQSIFRTPIAVVTLGERTAWVFEARGPDGAQLDVMELSAGPSRPRSVWQGSDGCGRGGR